MAENVQRDRGAVPPLDALLQQTADAGLAQLADALAAGFGGARPPGDGGALIGAGPRLLDLAAA